MNEPIEQSGRAIADALLAVVRGNPRVRDALRTLAVELIAALDAEPKSGEPIEAPVAQASESPIATYVPPLASASPPTVAANSPTSPPVEQRELQLTFGGVSAPVRVPAVDSTPALSPRHGSLGPTVVAPAPQRDWPAGADQSDLSLVIDRCHLKSEACRWACNRRRRMADGEDYRGFGDGYRELVARAKEFPYCFLWMIPADFQLPPDDEMTIIAGCYDALADAAEFVLKLVGGDDGQSPLDASFHLLAEAQSALRAALLPVLDYRQDADQRDAYEWLRRQTSERQIFITRHMKVDDPASSIDWAALRQRITDLRASWENRNKQTGERRKLLGKVRYHATKTAAAGGEDEWRRLADAVEHTISAGVPPSNSELREALAPLADTIPEMEFGPGMGAVLEEVDRYLSTLSTAPPADESETAELRSPEVRQVADLLRGKKIMLVGGERRAQAQHAIEQAFELDELIWPTAGHHQSVYTFEADVAKPEVALVIMAIRWSSHSFGELKDLCDRHGKPFVRLPAGYNPSQVAHVILEQVGRDLSAQRQNVAAARCSPADRSAPGSPSSPPA